MKVQGNIEYDTKTILVCYCHSCGGEFTALDTVYILNEDKSFKNIFCPYCSRESLLWSDENHD